MAAIIDDKSEHVIPFILSNIQKKQENCAGSENPSPFFLGLNGIQGAGKTVLVSFCRLESI